ncbi:MAG: hypothetical protein NZ108_02090 [Bacteroidia bacterium]|nr:hypothetical protein [Bacteroidia bacterium]
MKKNFFKSLWFLLFWLSGCGNNQPIFPVIPSIEFISMEPRTVREGETFRITFSFKDGDGDLGNNSDTKFLFITDTLTGTQLPYNIPDLSTDARKPSIQGTITVSIPGIYMTNPLLPSERRTFSIKLKDRAGNESNIIYTPPLIVLP